MSYDSRIDTLSHSRRVGELLGDAIHDLVNRSTSHDLSKLTEPELSTYNEFVPLLREAEFGTEEYERIRQAMGPGLAHHYEHNAHHPESSEYGVDGMTLVDLIEMLADWKAAAERNDGRLGDGIAKCVHRFGIGDQLTRILCETAEAFGWLNDNKATPTPPEPTRQETPQ